MKTKSSKSYSFKAPWYQAVNWEQIAKYAFLIMLSVCLMYYLGVFVFWPSKGGS